MKRNIAIKQIIAEATGKDPQYSFKDIKPIISDELKQLRGIINNCVRRLQTIKSMAGRAQKRGDDYSEQIRSNAWELKEDVKEIFQFRNQILHKITQSLGELPQSIQSYFINDFTETLFKADSGAKYILGFFENPQKVEEYAETTETALSNLNDSLYSITKGMLY